jgi:glycine/D-amino acid oxidase-like deaminating enzyme
MSMVSENLAFDVIVIGGGFFGAQIALRCQASGARVVIVERESDLLTRASWGNQARVHGGYHYPRSLMTGLRSQANYQRFVHEFKDCVKENVEHYYAIANLHSKVSAQQFASFCKVIKAPLKKAPAKIKNLFNVNLIEDVFRVEECVFDADSLRKRMREELERSGVTILTSHDAQQVMRKNGSIMVNGEAHSSAAASQPFSISAGHIYLCNYAAMNPLLAASSLEPISLDMRVSELAFIHLPEELKNFGVTVMCGPFFSVLPFPAKQIHTLSHVRYTHVRTWNEPQTMPKNEGLEPFPSLYPYMIRDAVRYLPMLSQARYEGSHWETKALLPRNSVNDGRPILFSAHRQMAELTCVVGSKIDNIYDVYEEMTKEPISRAK